MQLIPKFSGSGMTTQSTFYLNMEVRSPNGQVKYYTFGTPAFVRQQILSYNIKKVLIDSTGNSMIVVIEMKRAAGNGHDIRYMVEAVRL